MLFTTEIESIDNLSVYLKYAEVHSEPPYNYEQELKDKVSSLTDSLNEAIYLLENGWKDGAIKLTQGLKEKVNITNTKRVKRLKQSPIGFQVHVPNYIQGIPNSMFNHTTNKTKAVTCNIYIDISYPADLKPQEIIDISVDNIRVINVLESNGIKVNLFSILGVTTFGNDHLVVTKLKGSNERLNISKLAFPLMHPAYLRRILFRVLSTDTRIPETEFSVHMGYVAPISLLYSYISNNILLRPYGDYKSKIQDVLQQLEGMK